MKIIQSLSVFFIFLGCSTIEFIPDSNYSPTLNSHALTWQDVEIRYKRPERNFLLYGTVLIRDFNKVMKKSQGIMKLKRKLFSLHFDGIWIVNARTSEVPPLVISTQNLQGVTVSVYNANQEVKILKGYPFRYKNGSKIQ